MRRGREHRESDAGMGTDTKKPNPNWKQGWKSEIQSSAYVLKQLRINNGDICD